MKFRLFAFLIGLFTINVESISINKNDLWNLLLEESRTNSKHISGISGKCPNIIIGSINNRLEAVKACISLLNSISKDCKTPSKQATYLYVESNGRSMKLIGLRDSSKREIQRVVEKFCKIVIQKIPGLPREESSLLHSSSSESGSESSSESNSESSKSSDSSSDNLESSSESSKSSRFSSESSVSSESSLSPKLPNFSSSHLQEWNYLVDMSSFGTGSKYISSIPKSPYPRFRLGNDISEKIEQCVKSLRGMVKASAEMNKCSFVEKKFICSVTSLSNDGAQKEENLVIFIDKDSLSSVKQAIKGFCESIYEFKGGRDETEWKKISDYSYKSNVLKKLPLVPPLGYKVVSENVQDLMDSCVNSIHQIIKDATKKRINTSIKRNRVKANMKLTGKYVDINNSEHPYQIELSCSYPCNQEEISESVSKFCRKLYWNSPIKQEKGKKIVLEELYQKIQSATLKNNCIFCNFPAAMPHFLKNELKFDLEEGTVSSQTFVDLCVKFIQLCWDKSFSKLPDVIKNRPVSISGVSSTQIIKVGLDWNNNKVDLSFPFIDPGINPNLNFEKVTQHFCKEIFISVPVPESSYSEPVISTLPSEKYIGKRPPIHFPQHLSEKLTINAEFSGQTLLNSRSIWKKLFQHSNSGIGSKLITGLGMKRPVSFLTTGTEESIFSNCFNLIVSIYNRGNDYRLSKDETTLKVKKQVAVDLEKDGGSVENGMETFILLFNLPKSNKVVSTQDMLYKIIEEFCQSFTDILK